MGWCASSFLHATAARICHCTSARPSVCPGHALIVSKRLWTYRNSFTVWYAYHSSSWKKIVP